MTPVSRTRLKIWFVLVGVFALGGLTGAALDGLYRSRVSARRLEARGGDPEARFEAMRRDLQLSDEQATAIRAILDETRNEYRALRAELQPRLDEPRQRARVKIRALLSPDQQQRFDAMVAQHDAMHDEHDKHRH